MKKGRPPIKPTQKIYDKICDELSGGKSLRKICTEHDDLPGQTTIFKWLSKDEEFAKQYAYAREAQADAIFDECLDIADDGTNDYMGDDDEYNGDHVQRTRIRIDTRKWMAGKLRPKKYGDKIDVTSGGEKLTSELDDVAKVARLAAIASKINKRSDEPSDDT